MTNQTTTKGSAPGLSVTYDPATNRRTGESADANGNICSTYWASCSTTYTYDVENRIVFVGGSPSTPVVAAYSYAPGNKRVWRGVWSGYIQTVDEITFWGASGQKLTTYNISVYATTQLVASATGSNYYFGGKLIKNTGGYVTPDRLGSIGKYFPYGQERPSATTDGKEKFATYFRDSETGLDYADQRYHQPGMGRFMTPDPSRSSAGPDDPGSWNRYAYTRGDPVNRADPGGLDDGPIPVSGQSVTVNGGGNMGDGICYMSLDEFDATYGMEWSAYYYNLCGGGLGGGGETGLNGDPEGGDPQGPSCTSGSVTNARSSAQDALLGGKSWNSLSAAQQLVFYTITADAAKIGINLSGYTLGSISIANGSLGSQTELYLTPNPDSTAFADLKASLNSSFASAGWDPFHRGGYGAGGNWRQITPTNSMQIVATVDGHISIDIDPNNPNLSGGGNLGSVLRHGGNVIHNTFTGTDTNYGGVATALNIGIARCP